MIQKRDGGGKMKDERHWVLRGRAETTKSFLGTGTSLPVWDGSSGYIHDWASQAQGFWRR